MSISAFPGVWKSLRFNHGGKAFQNLRGRSVRVELVGQFPDETLQGQVAFRRARSDRIASECAVIRAQPPRGDRADHISGLPTIHPSGLVDRPTAVLNFMEACFSGPIRYLVTRAVVDSNQPGCEKRTYQDSRSSRPRTPSTLNSTELVVMIRNTARNSTLVRLAEK